jgi:biotin operon repressor
MKAKNMELDKYFTVSQLASILGISRIAVHKKIKNELRKLLIKQLRNMAKCS